MSVSPPETPLLDAVELTATAHGRTERLSDAEYLLLEQLIRFREQSLTRDSLKGTLDKDEQALSDRALDKMMVRLIAKTNVLYPTFPLVRRISRDTWLYTEVPPKRKARA